MSGRGRGINNAPAWMTRGGGGGPPPPHYHPPRDSGPPPFRGDYDRRPYHRGENFGRRPRPNRQVGIRFQSYQHEREWVERRRKNRMERPSKFDVMPTEEQSLLDLQYQQLANPGATDFAGFSGGSQQTRHARRLYIGNLPLTITEQELHDFFWRAIQESSNLTEDPILSVYINPERRFCFLEFKTVDITTACLALDGIMVQGHKLKIKRPNDYNPTMAPTVGPESISLDVHNLGIISTTVPDGPNKIFLGGLHYNYTEQQVLELVQAFGQVKAFHLVKNEGESNSKGYCFIEYSDPAVTNVAVMGLNGMDLGGGKVLTARVAGERHDTLPLGFPTSPTPAPAAVAPRPGANIVQGYDVEELIDAAMGLRPMPTAPVHVDAMGMPITRMNQVVPAPPPVLAAAPPVASRIVMLGNMVTPQDLATPQDTKMLLDEVEEECKKFGTLQHVSMLPNDKEHIFLEYSNVAEASRAIQELQGRPFGDSVVQANFKPEAEYVAQRLQV